jgi:benzoate-CoA ligase
LRPAQKRGASRSSPRDLRDLVGATPEQFNVAEFLIDRNVRQGNGARTAIECGAQKISYEQLLRGVNRVGNLLRALDVRPEERVLLLLLDTPEFLYSFFGTIKIGAVAVPLNTLLKPHEYEFLFNDTRARVLIVSEALEAHVRSLSTGRLRYLKHIIVARESRVSRHSLRRLMEESSAELEAEAVSQDDVAFWLYSSGSTGDPKACIHRHRDMVVCSELYAKAILKMNSRDRCYSVPRLFFAYGLGNIGYFPLYAGATTVLSPARPTPAGIFADIERYRPTLFFSVPTNYAALLDYEPDCGPNHRKEFDLSSIRHAVSAGEALPASVFARFKRRFGIEVLDAWGSTETLHMAISNRPGKARPGSSGKVIPGYEASVVDDRGDPVSPETIGNLLIRGDSTCVGYWNRHEKNKRVFRGHWFWTGDKYRQDKDGYLWYAGRSDDLFKVNGRWLSPTEVEGALAAHPAVREAAVVARLDKNGNTKPAAYVVVRAHFHPGEAFPRELQQFVADRIGAYKRPRWIEVVAELPKTATGKLQRYKLREHSAPPRTSSRAR